MTNAVWSYVGEIPEDVRHKVIAAVMHLEKFSATKRANDNVLCAGGMAQMIASLAAQAAAGKAPQEAPNAPGMIGKDLYRPARACAEHVCRSKRLAAETGQVARDHAGDLASLMKLSKPPAK